MVKLRSAMYCNLKLLLIYLVIYGHWIEAGIWDSEPLRVQYRLIYLVHMPLFAFLTGLFVRTEGDCLRQMQRLLPMYGLMQMAAVLLGGGAVKPGIPFWHLWYLLSSGFWMAAAWLWFRFAKGRGKGLILALSILLGCLAGKVSWLDRVLSGSRTVVFFPYFWMGVLCNRDIPWRKYRLLGIALLAGAGLLALGLGDQIPVVFLYHAAPFGRLEDGEMLRLLCYGLGTAMGFGLLTVMPDRRMPFTQAGADTMGIYLLHGPIVALLRELNPNWLMCPVNAALLLYVLYRILKWNTNLYGIVSGERRELPWPGSKQSTKNMENRSTGSSCP